MSGQMTSRERMLAAIRREEHDYVPLSLHIAQGPMMGEPFFWHDQFERARKLLDMGLDPAINVWLPDPEPHADVRIESRREKRGQEILITKEYHTPAGVLRQVVRETEDWCDYRHGLWVPTTWGTEKRDHFGVDLFDDHNVSRRLEPWVKGREDLEKLKYIIRPIEGNARDEWLMDTERAVEFAEKHKVLTHAKRTIVGDAFQWFCDIPWFLIQFYEDPEFVREFFAIFQDWSMSQVALALETDVDVVQYRGWYEIPNNFGGKWWKEFLYEGIQGQTELAHSGGKYMSYLLPEGYGAYCEDLKDLDADVFYYLDPRMLHGGDLGSLAKAHGKNKCFWGGIDAEVTLLRGGRDGIDKAVREAIGALNCNNGLILSSTGLFFIPSDSILQMVESWKKYRTGVPECTMK